MAGLFVCAYMSLGAIWMSLCGYSCACMLMFTALCDGGVWVWLCTLVWVWGRRINIYTQWFHLEQVREDGGTSTQTIKKLVIKRFKILGSQKEISATHTIAIWLNDVCKSTRWARNPRGQKSESQSQNSSQDKKSGRTERSSSLGLLRLDVH